MATDGPTPPPCSTELFENGHQVAMLQSIGSNAIERWVKSVAEKSGQDVDWHFAGGRAIVLALGDLDRVAQALDEFMPRYKELYVEHLIEDGFFDREYAERIVPYLRYV